MCVICASHSVDAEDSGFIGCDVVLLGEMLPTFFLNCFTLKLKALCSFEMLATIHPMTVSYPTRLQSHTKFLEQWQWKE
jgi:hypothetical protein